MFGLVLGILKIFNISTMALKWPEIIKSANCLQFCIENMNLVLSTVYHRVGTGIKALKYNTIWGSDTFCICHRYVKWMCAISLMHMFLIYLINNQTQKNPNFAEPSGKYTYSILIFNLLKRFPGITLLINFIFDVSSFSILYINEPKHTRYLLHRYSNICLEISHSYFMSGHIL